MFDGAAEGGSSAFARFLPASFFLNIGLWRGGGVMDAWKEQEGNKKNGAVRRRTTRRATRASLVGPLFSPVSAAPLRAVVVSDGGAGWSFF